MCLSTHVAVFMNWISFVFSAKHFTIVEQSGFLDKIGVQRDCWDRLSLYWGSDCATVTTSWFLCYYFFTFCTPSGEPPKEIGCEFCGEYFENRKGLSSHARSHLRQMGITEWSVNGSPIDTLREIIIRQGLSCALPLKTVKSKKSSPGPPISPLPTSSSTSPSANLLSRLPFAFTHPSSRPQSTSKSSSAPTTSSSSGLILKLKPEPAQLEVTTPGNAGKSDGVSGETLNWSSAESVFPLNLGKFKAQFFL